MSQEAPARLNHEERANKVKLAVDAYKEYQKAQEVYVTDPSEKNKNAVNVAVLAYRQAVAVAEEAGTGEGEICRIAKGK